MTADLVVDASGLRCPLPVIRAAAAAKSAPAGSVLRIISTDPASEYDLPAWAGMRGYTVLDLTRDGERIEATIQL